jgi:hypothetical protein
MRYSQRTAALTLAGVVAVGIAASGCATPWFGTPQPKTKTAAAPGSPDELKQAAVAYIDQLCKLPKEQRDSMFRELNEALLPNHASVSCGRGGEF